MSPLEDQEEEAVVVNRELQPLAQSGKQNQEGEMAPEINTQTRVSPELGISPETNDAPGIPRAETSAENVRVTDQIVQILTHHDTLQSRAMQVISRSMQIYDDSGNKKIDQKKAHLLTLYTSDTQQVRPNLAV